MSPFRGEISYYGYFWTVPVKNCIRNFSSRRQEVWSDALYRPMLSSTCRESGKSMDNEVTHVVTYNGLRAVLDLSLCTCHGKTGTLEYSFRSWVLTTVTIREFGKKIASTSKCKFWLYMVAILRGLVAWTKLLPYCYTLHSWEGHTAYFVLAFAFYE